MYRLKKSLLMLAWKNYAPNKKDIATLKNFLQKKR